MSDAVALSVIISVLVGLAVMLNFGLAGYAWRRIDHPVSDAFARLLVAYGVWTGCYLGMILGPEGPLTRAAVVGQGIGCRVLGRRVVHLRDQIHRRQRVDSSYRAARAVGVGGRLQYLPDHQSVQSHHRGHRLRLLRLFVLPAEVYGPGLLSQYVVANIVVLSAFVLLLRFIRQAQSLYRYPALIILIAIAVNTGGTLLFTFGIQLHPQLDLTPVLTTGQGIAVWAALYRYDFLRTAPVAADRFFREMADPALIIDNELTVIEFNRAATAILGTLTKRSELAETNSSFAERLETTIADAETAGEFTTDANGGPKRTYDIEVTRVTDQFDITQGYVVVLRDITDRKQRERQLEEQNERLEEFADIVSHDLRNPLSTAEGWVAAVTDALDAEEPDVETANMGLEHIAHSHDRMNELIDVLLTMARQGQTVADPEPVSLDECATNAWATADTDGMELRVETDRTVPADPARLRQAFENLFRNANDHSNAATVMVTTTAEGFAVEDDGVGIDPDDREDLFEFGYTTDEEGTGIGLAVVERIIEAHGWGIEVGESDDDGARFEITGVSQTVEA